MPGNFTQSSAHDPLIAPRPSVLALHRQLDDVGASIASQGYGEPDPDLALECWDLHCLIVGADLKTIGDAALLVRVLYSSVTVASWALDPEKEADKCMAAQEVRAGLRNLKRFLCRAADVDFAALQLADLDAAEQLVLTNSTDTQKETKDGKPE